MGGGRKAGLTEGAPEALAPRNLRDDDAAYGEASAKLEFPRTARGMPNQPYKPRIFISYSHADEPEKPAEGEVKWLSFVTGYLRPAERHGAVELWIDRLIPGGADWERENADKPRACDIFILLVSPDSLSSNYVLKSEIPIIRERQVTPSTSIRFS